MSNAFLTLFFYLLQISAVLYETPIEVQACKKFQVVVSFLLGAEIGVKQSLPTS